MKQSNCSGYNIKQLTKIFNEWTAYGRPHYKAASSGTFELVRAFAAYDKVFAVAIERALLAKFSEFQKHGTSSDAERRAAENAADCCDVLAYDLRGLGIRKNDERIILHAIRAAAFDWYSFRLIESRRFAK